MVTSNPFEVITNELSQIKELILKVVAQQEVKDDFSSYPELLCRKQAAQMLGIGTTTLDRHSNEGLFKKHRNGFSYNNVFMLFAFLYRVGNFLSELDCRDLSI